MNNSLKEKEIILRRKRDFGEKINATFAFISRNFAPLYKSILFILGPIIAITGASFGLLMQKISNPETLLDGLDSNSIEDFYFGLFQMKEILGMMFFGSIGYIIAICLIYGYLKLYLNGERDISTEMVWGEIKGNFLKVLISVLGLFLFTLFISFILIFIFGIMITVTGAEDIGLILLLVFLFFGVFIYLITSIAFIFVAQVIENIGFLQAIGRSFKLIQNHWWSSLGFFVILSLITSCTSYIFQLPMQIVNMINTFHTIQNMEQGMNGSQLPDFLMIFFGILTNLGTYATLPILYIGIAFQYFNLVEHKDQTGLKEQISAFGTLTDDEEEEEEY
ncbi:hypothetical protein AAG747_11880 [Rapidithrix thailandica]|uniref:Uncharacterized protein n=1 Tax=Rapidithrix thailandica TaxID=413964 RepID=A0AAW9S8B9_9BACT